VVGHLCAALTALLLCGSLGFHVRVTTRLIYIHASPASGHYGLDRHPTAIKRAAIGAEVGATVGLAR